MAEPGARQREELGSLAGPYDDALRLLESSDAPGRLAARDPTLWKDDPAHAAVIRNRLGWLDGPAWLRDHAEEVTAFASDVRADGFTRVLLLGMGGSSLAPEVLKRCMVAGPGAPILDVLDSTDPAAVRAAEEGARLDRTFVLVASKSGATLETVAQYRYLRDRIDRSGTPRPGAQIAAITDPGSPLEALAASEGFRRVFRNPPDIGGRYSALSYFGMAPAALLGLDLGALAASAEAARADSLARSPAENAALRLGALLGAAARAGRDKLTLLTAPFLRPFGFWIEQLVAESTGKEGTGLVPVEGEPLGAGHHYGADRVFVSITVGRETDPDLGRLEREITKSGGAWVRIDLADRDQLAGEFFRWEAATAFASAVLGIDPFDEPDVQESKDATRRVLEAFERDGAWPAEEPRAEDQGVEIHADDALWRRISAGTPANPSLEWVLRQFLALARPGEYLALLSFTERTAATEAAFALMRRAVRNALHVPVLQGYGPRYLHSIGQLFKGGPRTGIFLLVTCEDEWDAPVPGSAHTFGRIKAAQALGDAAALASRGKPVLRLHLTRGVAPGLEVIGAALERAVASSARV